VYTQILQWLLVSDYYSRKAGIKIDSLPFKVWLFYSTLSELLPNEISSGFA